jgi:hypothetical protein
VFLKGDLSDNVPLIQGGMAGCWFQSFALTSRNTESAIRIPTSCRRN